MYLVRFLSVVGFVVCCATNALAVPSVSVTWDDCVGPTDKTIVPGSTVSLYASVLGQDQPHQGYQVQLRIATGTGALPDAWRFDPAGCQGSSQLAIAHLSSLKTCPSFQGALFSFQVKDYSYNSVTGVALTQLFNAYPNFGLGNTTQIDPTIRYFLGSWTFNHSLSVNGPGTPPASCGGAETPLCSTATAQWTDVAGTTRPYLMQNEYFSMNSAAVGTCPPVTPAANRTWGSIKGQYKR